MNGTAQGLVALMEILVGGLDEPGQKSRLTLKCAELLDMQAASLLALDADGAPVLQAASEETAELLSRFELVYEQGPGVDAFRTGERVECADLSAAHLRWPDFAPVALEAGVFAAYGLPCLLRGAVVGAVALYGAQPRSFAGDGAELGRGVANAVSLGLDVHQNRELALRATQLQGALDSRVAIEQAKGVLAERAAITVEEAFTIMRDHARGTGSKMRDVARDVVSGALKFRHSG
jgi:hypothetical protein